MQMETLEGDLFICYICFLVGLCCSLASHPAENSPTPPLCLHFLCSHLTSFLHEQNIMTTTREFNLNLLVCSPRVSQWGWRRRQREAWKRGRRCSGDSLCRCCHPVVDEASAIKRAGRAGARCVRALCHSRRRRHGDAYRMQMGVDRWRRGWMRLLPLYLCLR